jgi:hypothetical protein
LGRSVSLGEESESWGGGMMVVLMIFIAKTHGPNLLPKIYIRLAPVLQ